MADIFEPEVRSYTMSRIRKVNTKPELLVRKFLFKNGLRFRIHDKRLIGTPDVVLPKYRAIVFINGCFWHAHEGCRLNRIPKSRQEYWITKINKNVNRDNNNKMELTNIGWRVITVWECELAKHNNQTTLNRLVNKIKHI